MSFWAHNINALPDFLEHLNNIDSPGKIKFIMQTAVEDVLKFLGLKLKMNENSEITLDVL